MRTGVTDEPTQDVVQHAPELALFDAVVQFVYVAQDVLKYSCKSFF